MAEFCQECSIDTFGTDFKEFANALPESKYTEEVGALVLCESCGPIVVDINGKCVSPDCEIHGETK